MYIEIKPIIHFTSKAIIERTQTKFIIKNHNSTKKNTWKWVDFSIKSEERKKEKKLKIEGEKHAAQKSMNSDMETTGPKLFFFSAVKFAKKKKYVMGP